jgi:DNA-binding SARP family transcriptional activator
MTQAVGTKLQLLQRFELRHQDRAMSLPESVQRLLALLALRNRPQHRVTVAGTLWMDTTEARAAANLRTALWRARRVDKNVVVSDGAYLAIGSSVEVDIIVMLDQARRLLAEHEVDYELIDDAVACTDSLAGDLLPEWYDDWVLLERERLRQIRLHGLEALCTRLSSQGRYALAIEAGLIAAGEEPLRESAHRALISAHLLEGNFAEAVRQYDRFATALLENLGITPTEALRTLLAPCR